MMSSTALHMLPIQTSCLPGTIRSALPQAGTSSLNWSIALCLEDPFRRSGILLELLLWSNGSFDELPTTIRADAMSYLGGAIAAERALERADKGFQ
jgi:hypothetical protein